MNLIIEKWGKTGSYNPEKQISKKYGLEGYKYVELKIIDDNFNSIFNILKDNFFNNQNQNSFDLKITVNCLLFFISNTNEKESYNCKIELIISDDILLDHKIFKTPIEDIFKSQINFFEIISGCKGDIFSKNIY